MLRKIIKVPANIEDHYDDMIESTNTYIYGGIYKDIIVTSRYHDKDINENKCDIIYYIGDFIVNNITYQVQMYSNEINNPTPHFHVVEQRNVDNGVDLCFNMCIPEYYFHDGTVYMPSYRNILNMEELKALNNLLKSDIGDSATLWKYLCSNWNHINEQKASIQPNYAII